MHATPHDQKVAGNLRFARGTLHHYAPFKLAILSAWLKVIKGRVNSCIYHVFLDWSILAGSFSWMDLTSRHLLQARIGSGFVKDSRPSPEGRRGYLNALYAQFGVTLRYQ